MALKIKAVALGSLAEKAGVRPGQLLKEMNGQPIEDILDYRFYLHEETLQLLVEDEMGSTKSIEFRKAYAEDLGLELPEIHPRGCRNKCIFCFVDQLPRGMRKSLYFKDEDYRLSFLRGNYVTLSDLKDEEIKRIIRQRLSPLYISVHSTDESVRNHLMGRRGIPGIIDRISRLAQGGIHMHCQLVICPGLNDKEVLDKSIEDLASFYPYVLSAAVVPVGLTGHRQGLEEIQMMGQAESAELIEQVGYRHRSFRRTLERGFAYLADEIFLMAGQEVPPMQYYDDFPQLENGVGMVRQFLDLFAEHQESYPDSLTSPKHMTLITGTAAEPFLRDVVVRRLSQVENLTVYLVPVVNKFFGESVTVSGLLTGTDILAALKGHPFGGTVILPPHILNQDGLFLDDMCIEDLQRMLGVPVEISPCHHPLSIIEEVFS